MYEFHCGKCGIAGYVKIKGIKRLEVIEPGSVQMRCPEIENGRAETDPDTNAPQCKHFEAAARSKMNELRRNH